MIKSKPYLINFLKFGKPEIGYISVAEKKNLPFIPKRIYWTYSIPKDVERGGHAHIELEQILIAACGEIKISIELINGETFEFKLENPNVGLYIPKKSWRTMKYSYDAVQICIASKEYNENDYIRNYNDFLKLK